MAVSAVIPRFPLMTVFTRWIGTPIRDASSTCVMARGLRNSSSSISPGAVGGRFFGSMVVLTSVVVDDLDIARIAALEAEDDPVLVDPDAEVPRVVTLQGLQPVARRVGQFPRLPRPVESVELPPRRGPQLRGQAAACRLAPVAVVG